MSAKGSEIVINPTNGAGRYGRSMQSFADNSEASDHLQQLKRISTLTTP
jgi:hypothetical protein